MICAFREPFNCEATANCVFLHALIEVSTGESIAALLFAFYIVC
jgi:hypothetical protein